MSMIQTVFWFLGAFLTALACGYGVVTLLLPKEYDEYRFIIMVPFGYTFLGWMTYLLSGNFNLQVPVAAWASLGFSVALGVYAWVKLKKDKPKTVLRQLGQVFLISAPLLVMMLWPLFKTGTDTFIGANNPDWFASFIDNFFLRQNSVRAQSAYSTDTYNIIGSMAGHMPPSARFSSGFFSILLEMVLGVTQRNALSLSIAIFLFSLPLSVYFMSRVAFGFSRRTALIAAFLMGINAPTAMSFVYYYVGQNSGLGILPMVLTVGYIMVMRPTIKSVLMSTILIGSFIVMYFGMLPYALAPVGVVGAYRLFQRKYKAKELALMLGGIPLALTIACSGMLGYMKAMFFGWTNIVGQTLQGQYFLDFLSEHFFIIFLGLTSYPIGASFQDKWLRSLGVEPLPVLYALTAVVLAALTYLVVRWSRENWKKNSTQVILAVAGFVIYGYVWYAYTFNRQYGYAVFKMCAWLQFFLVLPVAYGIDRLWTDFSKAKKTTKKAIASVSLVLFLTLTVGGNFISTLRYTTFSLGKNTIEAKMINNYGFSGNKDYLALADAVNKYVKPGQSIGFGFSDSILNFWAAYYLRDHRLSMLSHVNMPGDDENLPDIVTRKVVDYYGNVRLDRNEFFHGGSDDFYLTASPTNLNQDIVDQTLPAPIWENKTFRLYKASDLPNFAFTGRGWYRLEYTEKDKGDFWMPKTLRFTSEGGEIYMVRASQPGKPYRLSFVAFVGYGNKSANRKLELWHNQTKFDEVEVQNGMARIVSKPFYATGDVDRLVIRVVDRTKQISRAIPLWNKNVPLDYRRTNIAVSSVRIYPPKPDLAPQPALAGEDIIEKSFSFNGMDQERWSGRLAEFSFARPNRAKQVKMQLFMPGNPGFEFPTQLEFQVDGKKGSVTIRQPGPFEITSPLAEKNADPVVTIRAKSNLAIKVRADNPDAPDMERAFRLDQVTFD